VEPASGPAEQLMLSHQTQKPFLMARGLVHTAPGGPAATVAPKRQRRLHLSKALQQRCGTLDPQGRLLAAPLSIASLCFRSQVRSPTRVFNRAFSRAKRASRWLCAWTSKAWGAWAKN
jgi:hypothetical protein